MSQPIATPQTNGAFRLGLPLIAADSMLDEVAEMRANASYFGRLSGRPTQNPFSQVRCFYLAEWQLSDYLTSPAAASSARADY